MADGFIAPSDKEQEFLDLIRTIESEKLMDVALAQLKALVDLQ